jgi:hypothetical protein
MYAEYAGLCARPIRVIAEAVDVDVPEAGLGW